MTCLATPCPIPERSAAVVKPSVLLVEDDRLTRIVLRDFLKQLGYVVDVAENGEVAMAKLDRARRQGQSSSLILTDVVMPKMTGDRLLELLQQSDHRHIPVAVMSASAEATLAERLITLGAAEFFVKPMSKGKLSTLRRHIRATAPSAAPGASTTPPAAARPPVPPPRRESHESCRSQARNATPVSPTTTHMAVRDASPSHSSAGHAAQSAVPVPSRARSAALPVATGASGCASSSLAPQSSGTLTGARPMDSSAGCNALCAAAAMLSAAAEAEEQQRLQQQQHQQQQQQRQHQAAGKHAQAASAPAAPPPCFPCGTPSVSKEARCAALARFRAKKAKRLLAPKVRYAARKKLAEARPRYRGQFIKADALPPGASWDPPAGSTA